MGFFDKWKRKKNEPVEMYRDLREQWMTGSIGNLTDSKEVQAVMMEMGGPRGVVCFLAGAEGSASMYTGAGGGIIGGQGIPEIAEAAKEFVRQAAKDLSSLADSHEIPSAKDGTVAFCVRTRTGLRTSSAPDRALRESQHPLRELFEKGQSLVTEFRLHEQSKVPLNVYLHADGGLMASNGQNPKQAWCTLGQLLEAIELAKSRGTQLRLHAPAKGDSACEAALRAFEAIDGLERQAAPEPWPEGATSLHMAIAAKRVDIASDLLARGADFRAKDSNGYDALLLASYVGTHELVEAVLRAGADPNRLDDDGNSPLMFAAQRKDAESARTLLAAGADPNVKGAHGLTALAIARQYPENAVVRILEENGTSK